MKKPNQENSFLRNLIQNKPPVNNTPVRTRKTSSTLSMKDKENISINNITLDNSHRMAEGKKQILKKRIGRPCANHYEK